jgi:RNA polymerase sigma-70 factor (ECF subfamily)
MTTVQAEVLEELYRRRFNDFLRIARAITHDDALAHDAVQEAFARALRSTRYRGEGSPEAWVWGILFNVARSSLRGTAAPTDQEPVTKPPSEEPGSDFRLWISALPERQRLVVFLRYWADLDYAAIARALEIEIGTVSATLNAAHTTLRRALEEAS